MSLTLSNISYIVDGEKYIDDINITFTAGSFNVLLGRTLAGKTSLMRLIAGLDKPSSGSIFMDGVDVTNIPVQKRNIAMVYQQFINYPNLTVFENIASPLRIAGFDRKIINDRVKEIAQMLHIEPFLERRPLELSGGQQQRTAMARALIKKGGVILFDEPLVNLDYKLREQLRIELRELFKTQNTIAIYASTEPNEALALGGSTTLMHEGKAIQNGPVEEVYYFPNSIVAAELFGEPPINILALTINDCLGHINDSTAVNFQKMIGMRDLSNGQYKLGIRPHHISTVQQSDDDIAMDVSIDVAEISGSETFLHMTSAVGSIVAQLPGVHSFHTDTPIKIFFPVSKLYIFDLSGNMIHSPQYLNSLTNSHHNRINYG
ncbi:ABC transporter ATP-binding protein [Agarilytica rhodophyticola]|uniref:ABC transporter ATP-binding protein n=1 Tax=Agarilytica rhodophyticola TaxID=1737490 RepID=UPI000B34107F|nr:ABC transporter ATP-binding protein [Agarilytica rhodophyticola]